MSVQIAPQPTVSNSPPGLDSWTRNLLDDFIDRSKREKVLFENLKSRSSSASTTSTRRTKAASASSSAASSVSSKRRDKTRITGSVSRHVSDLLPGRRPTKEGDDEEEDADSLLAQAEALADLERLNGVEPSMPISTLREEESDDSDEHNDDNDDNEGHKETNEIPPHQMDVDEYRRYFGESWQLSQFWYSSEFSYHLARCIHSGLQRRRSDNDVSTLAKKTNDMTMEELGNTTTRQVTRTKRVGFISCPTAYVGFQYLYPEIAAQLGDNGNGRLELRSVIDEVVGDESIIESYLFEYDERFSLLTPPRLTLKNQGLTDRFVHYDLYEPLSVPSCLEAQLDMVIIDPPYLNTETNEKMAQTAKRLLKSDEEGKILLITGQSISEQAAEIYGNDKTGPLRRAEKLTIEHCGLANDFVALGNWDGIEEFGGED